MPIKQESVVEPFHDYVLIKPAPPDEKTEGGIIIPDSFKERMNKADVVALGELVADKKAKIGDTILHIKGAGNLVDEKRDHWLIKYNDILCKVY